MDTTTRFKGQIISADKYRESKSFRAAWGVTFAICYLLLGRNDHRGLLDIMGLGNTGIETLCFLIFFISGIVLVSSFFYSRDIKKKGSLIIYPEKVLITINNKETEYLINEIEELSITQRSFVKDENSDKRELFNGNNFITFKHNNTPIHFEFSIESFYTSNKLNEIVLGWKEHNIAIEYKLS